VWDPQDPTNAYIVGNFLNSPNAYIKGQREYYYSCIADA
jgi:hypothetical protein